ncbi:MAG: 7-cyano-7-deazaguanine synthase [Proteobacteria bacterium]|nr:7-cyano-7-deazaguanine synthase [Pseudomonadota bacterium]
MMNRKAISLLSGGLDSVLATKVIMEQGIEVIALHFTSPFNSRKEKERGLQAVRTISELGIGLILKHKGLEYIDIVRSPKYGYGKNINPCIDCRIFMLQKTKEIMAEEQASFVVTGEVLGQRPMSQRRDTIRIIEKASGLEGLIVRPLSAMHFLPSIPEQEGLLDREKLLGFTGRSRAPQYRLAEKYNLTEFGSPAGGCLLTDPIFTKKLKDLFKYDKAFTMKDLELLSIGRHFRLQTDTKLVVGRNEIENNKLISLWEPPYISFHPVGFRGPSAILKGVFDDKIINTVANIMGYYGKNESTIISIESNNGIVNSHAVERRNLIPEGLLVGASQET